MVFFQNNPPLPYIPASLTDIDSPGQRPTRIEGEEYIPHRQDESFAFPQRPDEVI